ncbi:MAG: sodium:calcium antiporter [Mariprofundaceae bacterium]
MLNDVLLLLFALVLVFTAAQMFTNALETIGERSGVSEGVTGSIFAAVGTAMPETIVPMVAIVAGGAAVEVNHAIGMGAILGAPFMLATLSLALMAWFAGRKRGWTAAFKPEVTGIRRDLLVFMFAFSLVIMVGLLPAGWQQVRIIVAILLGVTYLLYLLRTIRASSGLVSDGHGTEADQPLYFSRLLGDSSLVCGAQLITGLVILVWGAMLFVDGVEGLSHALHISPLILSLLIIPVATELPEKVNSIIWIRKGKDSLAFGNITGAMVFQGTVIPAVGMLLMPWNFSLNSAEGLSVMLALMGAAWLYYLLRFSFSSPLKLLANILLYAVFVVYVFNFA